MAIGDTRGSEPYAFDSAFQLGRVAPKFEMMKGCGPSGLRETFYSCYLAYSETCGIEAMQQLQNGGQWLGTNMVTFASFWLHNNEVGVMRSRLERALNGNGGVTLKTPKLEPDEEAVIDHRKMHLHVGWEKTFFVECPQVREGHQALAVDVMSLLQRQVRCNLWVEVRVTRPIGTLTWSESLRPVRCIIKDLTKDEVTLLRELLPETRWSPNDSARRETESDQPRDLPPTVIVRRILTDTPVNPPTTIPTTTPAAIPTTVSATSTAGAGAALSSAPGQEAPAPPMNPARPIPEKAEPVPAVTAPAVCHVQDGQEQATSEQPSPEVKDEEASDGSMVALQVGELVGIVEDMLRRQKDLQQMQNDLQADITRATSIMNALVLTTGTVAHSS